MMHVLLESAAPARARLVSWTSGSVVVHGVIVAAALWLTLVPEIAGIIPPRVEDIVYVTPPTPPRTMARQHSSAPVPRLGVVDIPPVAVPRITFPDYLPSVTSNADFPASSIFGDPRGRSTHPVQDAPFVESEVERIVRPRAGNRSPAYPSPLRGAGVEGEVLVRFVVDTLGRVEPRSIEIRESPHALFADAVREWLARTRYDPATIRGRPVRQAVEQRVGFTLRR